MERRTSERIMVNGRPAVRTTTESFQRDRRGGPVQRITSTEVDFNYGVPSGMVDGDFIEGGGEGDDDGDTEDVDDVAMATNPSGVPAGMGMFLRSESGMSRGSELMIPSTAVSRAGFMGGGMIS